MAVEYDANGTPILTNDSLISDVPPYTQALAATGVGGGVKDSKFNNLQPADPISPFPIGMLAPFMGENAPDGWLLCDGRSYDAAYFYALAEANPDFHGDGVFRVPDLRGRSPIGAASGFGSGENVTAPVRDVALGERPGDWRVHNHTHSLGVSETSGREAGFSSAGNALWNVYWVNWSGDAFNYMAGIGYNVQPSTGVNFIVYTGRPTLDTNGDILPECGQGAEIAPMTTRMMIEARLAAKGIGEEEIKMLKEQLEEIKKTEAK